MRFNSLDHLTVFRAGGGYPAIHNAIRDAVADWSLSDSFLDLCCSHGLVAEWLTRVYGSRAIGVDGDAKAIQAGREAGLRAPLVHLRISPATLPRLLDIVRDARVTSIIARRCLPELFGDDPEFGHTFFDAMRSAGVREVFLEGRKAHPGAVNALASVESEVALIADSFTMRKRRADVVYLKAVE